MDELRKQKFTELLNTIEKVTQENKIDDYFAQELIKVKKESLQEKQTVSNLEEICELKKKITELEMKEKQEFKTKIEIQPK